MKKKHLLVVLALLFFLALLLALMQLRFASAYTDYCDTECGCTDAQCGGGTGCNDCDGEKRESCPHKLVTDCVCLNCLPCKLTCDTSCGAECENAAGCNVCSGTLLYSGRSCDSSCACTGGSSEDCATKASVCINATGYKDYTGCSGSACTYTNYTCGDIFGCNATSPGCSPCEIPASGTFNIPNACTYNDTTINRASTTLVISTGRSITLINANLTIKYVVLNGTGNLVFINKPSRLIIEG